MKTLSDTDEFNILRGLGLHPKKLMSYFDVFRCQIEKAGETGGTISDAMKLAGLTARDKAADVGFALIVESTLCLQGADISTWAATWSKALRLMQHGNAIPDLATIFPDAPFEDLSLSTEQSKSGQDSSVWVLPQESETVKTEAT